LRVIFFIAAYQTSQNGKEQGGLALPGSFL